MCLYYDHAKQANDGSIVLYSNWLLCSKYVRYLQYNRAHEYDIIARVGGDIEMWLSHFFPTRELVS